MQSGCNELSRRRPVEKVENADAGMIGKREDHQRTQMLAERARIAFAVLVYLANEKGAKRRPRRITRNYQRPTEQGKSGLLLTQLTSGYYGLVT